MAEWSNRQIASKCGNAEKSEKAVNRAMKLLPTLRELEAAGITSLADIAAALNDRGIPTPRGGRWKSMQVWRVKVRLLKAALHTSPAPPICR
jgi:hypothetical protein